MHFADVKTLLIRLDDVCMNAFFLWERRPRRDGALQTNTHRPGGGAPTNTEALTTFAKRLIFVSCFKGPTP
jgi:hypothetical protein